MVKTQFQGVAFFGNTAVELQRNLTVIHRQVSHDAQFTRVFDFLVVDVVGFAFFIIVIDNQ